MLEEPPAIRRRRAFRRNWHINSPLPPPEGVAPSKSAWRGERGGGEGGSMPRKPKPINLARSLRQRDVPAEALLWRVLRNRAFAGFKFRRQHPIGTYVVDFACVACKVAIEVDGPTHLRTRRGDTKRATFLATEGWHVLRVWNTEVYDELESVKEAIYQLCASRSEVLKPPSPPPPLPPPLRS